MVNFQKTQFMQFHTKRATAGRPNSKIRISIDNNKLCKKDNTQFLGLIIDKNVD